MKRLSATVIACILCISTCFTGHGYEELSGYAHSYGSTAEKFTGTAQAYGASYEKLEETTEAYVNPLYEDVIMEEDLLEPKVENGDQPSMLATGQSDYATTISEAAGRMRQGMKNRETTIEVPIKTTSGMTGIAKTIFAEVLDHNGVADEGDYIRYQYGGWKSSASGYISGGMGYYTVTYTMTYYTTAAQEATVTSAVAAALKEINIEATDGAPKKIKKIYDYVTSHVTYDYTNLNNSSYLLKYTAYAALINGTAVCQGYANLMYRFCLEAGIDCRIISGTGNSTPHGWNIVQVGDKYYDIDATWDAGKSSYSYFLKSDSGFLKHTRGGDDGDSSTLEIDYTSADFYAQYPMHSASYSGDFTEHTHVYNSGVVTKAATCTSSGIRTYTCIGSGCGDTKTETISATGHSVVTDAAKAATCTESGLTEGSHCSVCKAVIKAQTSIAATGHKWDSGKITTAATCTTAGVKTYTCSSCKATKTETISAIGHTVVTDAAKAATCTESGLTEGSHCSVCKALIKAQTSIAATGHKMDTGKVITAATCTTEGVKLYTCSNCNKTMTEDIPATGHVNVVDAAKAATCTDSGLTEGCHCIVCNTVFVAQMTIAAKGHSWNSGKTTTEATCTGAEVKTYSCTACGETKTVASSSAGHTLVTDLAVEATCTSTGLTEGSHCSVCNVTIIEQEVTGMKSHTKVKVVTKATLTKDGSISYKCSACGIVLKSVAGASSTIIARPKTFTLSKTTYTYDGKVKNPTLTIKDSKGKAISSANYSVKKATGRKLVGTYTYKITFKGNYRGTKTVSFKINPKGTSIVSLTRQSKGFTVKWKKQTTQTTGYQIRYSTSSKMTNTKTVTISKNTTVSKTVSKLKSKKRYYVQVRTYKIVKAKKYYSSWSTAKYVVTK